MPEYIMSTSLVSKGLCNFLGQSNFVQKIPAKNGMNVATKDTFIISFREHHIPFKETGKYKCLINLNYTLHVWLHQVSNFPVLTLTLERGVEGPINNYNHYQLSTYIWHKNDDHIPTIDVLQ